MMWEKNGQMKILMADAVFPGAVPQHKVFESVQGEVLIWQTLVCTISLN